ncbi:MAG: U3 snoRNP protein [Piccolia ochrophora]|nr:MAG: U3 snoRNP protein [Piccolia ochrophora]
MPVARTPQASSRPRKGGTASTKNHRFEPFSTRINKIHIDPVHRVRRQDLGDDDGSIETTSSYFKTSLDHWTELNASEDFSVFTREVSPLCDSLPQILHHQDRIAEILVLHIGKRSAVALEPLLVLLTQFARDVGARFERHYRAAVELVASIASKHHEIEVIEWSFTCLAWLFKYLARLLVPDLRPTYDLMAPLLGKEQQKGFVSQFAAQAMSFLVRKAATAYHKNEEPLEVITKHALADLESCSDSRRTDAYKQGIMTLFSNAANGVERTLHSCAHAVIQCLLGCALRKRSEQPSPSADVACGVIISLIHHTDAANCSPVITAVLQLVEIVAKEPTEGSVHLVTRLLFIVASVRKGSRISNWEPLLRAIDRVLSLLLQDETYSSTQNVWQAMTATAIILKSSPLESTLSWFRPIMTKISEGELSSHFLYFCGLFEEFHRDRFQDFVLPFLQRSVVANWERHEDQLLLLLPKLVSSHVSPGGSDMQNKLVCPKAWQHRIVDAFRDLNRHNVSGFDGNMKESTVRRCYAYTNLIRSIGFDAAGLEMVKEQLLSLLRRTLDANPPEETDKCVFSVGKGFETYVLLCNEPADLDTTLWPLLCTSGILFAQKIAFLEALLSYTEKSRIPNLPGETYQRLVDSLTENLSSSSSRVRLLTLRVLLGILREEEDVALRDIISTALLIQEMPLSLETARTVSMHIRKFATIALTTGPGDLSSKKMVSLFMFGLLTVNFFQIQEDSVAALKIIAQSKDGEKLIWETAFRWIQQSPPQPHTSDDTDLENTNPPLTAFDCSNARQMQHHAAKISKDLNSVTQGLSRAFDLDHLSSSNLTPFARDQAFKVLNEVPQLAERRSRQFVPMFLKWTSSALHHQYGDILDESTPQDVTSLRSRKDIKAVVNIFAKFSNPTVLFRSDEAYTALIELLANGDGDIQKPSLEAIFTWKSPSITPYEENLRNILDEARFRDEIVVFLQVGEGETRIQPAHRPTLIPVIMRLLYGRIISRKSSATAQKGLEGKRRLVLQFLANFPDEEFQTFVDIALGPLAALQDFGKNGQVDTSDTSLVSARKQVGVLRMIDDMLKELGTRLRPYTEQLVQAVLYCLLNNSSQTLQTEVDSPVNTGQSSNATSRSIRQIGFRSLNRLFQSCAGFTWQPYMNSIFQNLIDPRLAKLPIETAQSPSGILQLFLTWSISVETVLFLGEYTSQTLSIISECLRIPSATSEVKQCAILIIKNVVSHCEDDADGQYSQETRRLVREGLLRPNLDNILIALTAVLGGSPDRDLLESAIEAVSGLAPFVSGSRDASRKLLDLSLFLLSQPPRRVSPKSKSHLLRVMKPLIRLEESVADEQLSDRIYKTFSSLFGFFRDRLSRKELCIVFCDFCAHRQDRADVAQLCASLNSFSAKRLEEPDFDRRLKAFHTISEDCYLTFTLEQWRPIVYNALFYIKENDELAIRSNSSHTLQRFIQSAREQPSEGDRTQFTFFLSTVVLPAVRKGVRELSELVRAEYSAVMAQIVRQCSSLSEVSDMQRLLVGDDDEASFFTNILHIQQHRRMRALRRLAAVAETGELGSHNISHFFLPLIEHFVFDRAEGEMSHNLAAETVSTIGVLGQWLDWTQFKAIIKRYIDNFQTKSEPEKVLIRLITVMVDTLGKALSSKTQDAQVVPGVNQTRIDDTTAPSQGSGEEDAMNRPRQSRLAETVPSQEDVSDNLLKKFLPPLTGFLHNKDESFVSTRIPVGVAVVKMIKMLPLDLLSDRLPPVLTDICHILRSKAQESRDVTRKTLAQISTLLGPSCFAFILKELKGALARGSQLHVLSFTLHSILVETIPTFRPGDLDYCLPQIVEVLMDDIFGSTGQEKEAEDYVSKMKEVKSFMSYDSMELLTRTTTPQHISQLIRPIQALLQEKLSLKIVKKIDEVFRRVGVGLLRNETVQNRDILVFCYEVLQETYHPKNTNRQMNEKKANRTKRYLVDLKGANKPESRGATTTYVYKNARFALDVLRAVLNKNAALQTASNLAAFIPIISDALLQDHEEVQTSALRLLTTIIKVPLPELDRNTGVYVAEAVKIIKSSPSTNGELPQASLKLIAALLRERGDANFEDKKLTGSLAYLLDRLKPDLEEPDRQGVTFNFLKAIMARKVMLPEVYDALDTVASIMVTNQTRGIRDAARSAYFQFVMEYPQGKGRFAKQLAFLVKNLDYPHCEGRQSVLEVVHLLLTKPGDAIVQDMISTFMVPLVMSLINDDSSDCREMAGVLLKEALRRADRERTQQFLSLLQTWLKQDDQPLLNRAALQCYGLLFEVHPYNAEKEALSVKAQLSRMLKQNLQSGKEKDWEQQYFALQLLTKICHVHADDVFHSNSAALWILIEDCLFFPHAWVKACASRLLGKLFAEYGKANAGQDLLQLPLPGPGGLELDADRQRQLCRKHVHLLKTPNLTEDLATQCVKNLLFLGRCLGANQLLRESKKTLDQDFSDEDIGDGEEVVELNEHDLGAKTEIQFLFERLSASIRREGANTRVSSLIPRTAALRLIAALCSTFPVTVLTPLLPTILLPLYHLTDDSIPPPHSTDPDFVSGYKALQSSCHEVMALLQDKVGTSEYIGQFSKTQKLVRERREDRKVKRRIAAVMEPERMERKKRRQEELKKAKRKERSAEERGKRRGW